jgi:hypothetical protein
LRPTQASVTTLVGSHVLLCHLAERLDRGVVSVVLILTARQGIITGEVYLRTLLVHGARAVLLAAHRAHRSGRPLDRLRQWALQCEQHRGHNKATVALANRLARIIWATWKHERPFNGNWARAAS